MEDSIKFCEEHGEYRGWYVESGRKDDADVTHGHLIDFRVVDDIDEEGGESSEERKIRFGKPVDEDVVGSYLFRLLRKVCM